jgi:hypothetical protein
VNNAHQANILPSSHGLNVKPETGLSIRGTAGPFVVQASNFAPGTTAADIEAAIHSVATDDMGNNGLSLCRIMTSNPTVMAEMVFTEKYLAEKVVETFNNQKADGRILHVYHKHGAPSPALRTKRSEPALPVQDARPAAPPKDLFSIDPVPTDDVEMTAETTYTNAREVADRDRREREDRRADPDVQDRRYGFANGRDRDRAAEKPKDLLPAREVPEQRMDDRAAPARRDEERDRGFDNRYPDRRDERNPYRRESRYNEYRRDDRPSQYGNGVGGSGHRGSDGYSRMYSDDLMRGPLRGGRGGGPRGGYR